MKSNTSVRSPKLANSSMKAGKEELSLGDTLRKAKKDLFFTRCVYGILILLVLIAACVLYYLGYIDMLVDWFYSLM